jgi:FlaA1/EpsC-like NDP-sugar epimerase
MREDAKGLCLILGGGGHASVLIECLLESYSKRFLAILDGDSSLWGTEVLGVPVLGGESMLPELVSEGAASFLVGVGGTSDNAPRRRLFETALSHNLQPVTLIHPTVICSRFAKIGSGSQLLPGSIVNAGAVVVKDVAPHSVVVGVPARQMEDH